jgi:HEAT repeat protein
MSLALQPLLGELAELGYQFTTVSGLRTSGTRYRDAVPVLMRWLPQLQGRSDRDEVVRALSVPWAKPAAARPLLAEFRRAIDDNELGLAWVVGNALEIVADDSVFDDLVGIVLDRRLGMSRQMVVLALGKSKRPAAVPALIDVLDDVEVSGHAVMALGRLRAVSARDRVAPFVVDGRAWVRKEASKALARMV